MANPIELTPVEMTPDVMQDLEDRGLIIRLGPGRHRPAAARGQTVGESLYESHEKWGPHKLIAVSVNRSGFAAFGTHADNEEFLLLGEASARTMYLAVAVCTRQALAEKIRSGTISPDDFVCLRVRYNDPEVSFFVMLKDVPHGEAASKTPGTPATFYVTESRDLGIDLTDFGDYELTVRE